VSEDHRSAAGQVFVEADGALLGLPDQLQEPPLALDQRQIIAAKLQQIKGEQQRIAGPALAAQSMEVRGPVVTNNYRLSVDQDRCGLEATRSVNDGREAIG
jgi:hypothetical protein